LDTNLIQGASYFFLAFLAFFSLGVAVRLVRRFHHFSIPSFLIPLLDNPVRRRIQSPRKIADRIDLRPCMSVIEVGPGAGMFTTEVARRVAPTGVVYAVDISPKTTGKLRARIRKQWSGTIVPIVASACDIPIQGAAVDRVFMVAVLAEIPDREKALMEFARVLKPDGLLSVSEFISDPDYLLRRTVTKWCRKVGFKVISSHGNLFEYTLNFQIADSH